MYKKLILTNTIYFGIFIILVAVLPSGDYFNLGWLLFYGISLLYTPIYGIVSTIKTKKIIIPNVVLFVHLSIFWIVSLSISFYYLSNSFNDKERPFFETFFNSIILSFVITLIPIAISAGTKGIIILRERKKIEITETSRNIIKPIV